MKRIGEALLVIWLAVSLAFVALRLAPGDAVDATLARGGVPQAEIDARRGELGLNDPIWKQYITYWAGLARADLGESLITGRPVSAMIGENLGPTVALAISALMVAVVLGLLLGLLAGLSPWRLLRWGAEGIASLALSTPVYWTATLAIYFFTIVLGCCRGSGAGGRCI